MLTRLIARLDAMWTPIASAVVATVALSYSASAQPPVRALTKPDAEFAESFTAITGVRELSDGRVLLTDSRDKRVVLLDFTRRTVTSVGRNGAGPGEWSTPSQLYALPSDTTLMPDFSNGRYFVVNPNGQPGATMRMSDNPALAIASLAGADSKGRLYYVAPRRAANPADGTSGVLDVLRWDRRTDRVENIATANSPKGERAGAMALGGGRIRMFTNLPFAAQDAVAISRDGRVAIVRANPYRVEWIAEDGTHTSGAVAATSNIRITDAEKQAFIKSQTRQGSFSVRGPGGGSSAGAGNGKSGAVPLNNDAMDAMTNPDMTWPAVKPPFLSSSALVAPDGAVWILRSRAHDDPIPSYDVFDTAGKVRERVTIPANTRVVAFGTNSVYLARTDDDDPIWLQRYRRTP